MHFDCTDIDLRMQFALDGGLTEHEEHQFFGHLAGCADCRVLYLSMALTEEPAEAEAEPAHTPAAHAVDLTEIEPPRPVPRGWRAPAWMLASVAAAALLIGGVAGGELGAREPERRLVVAAATSTRLENKVHELESQISIQQELLEKTSKQLTEALAALPPDVNQLATQLDAANQRIEELEKAADEQRKENATLRSRLAKLRAGDGAMLTPGAVCKAGSTRMEFEQREKWSSCGKPSSAAYKDKTSERVYWTVKVGDDMKTCMCDAAGK